MTPAALLVGLAVATPTLYAAVVQGSVPVDVALERLLVILVVTGVVWTALSKLLEGFVESAQRVASAEPLDAGDGPQQERRRR